MTHTPNFWVAKLNRIGYESADRVGYYRPGWYASIGYLSQAKNIRL
ncbi:hypothetical protein H6F93_01945 [Leptolyngbya sp. FACHB-671]|nr:hypothetical protein [Leptolyngbya sp. FACHB-671]MBD2066300.1 hypothetical protein [Leptolyngbya sp. FACHB-671]